MTIWGDDIYLLLTANTFKLYEKSKGKGKFKRVVDQNYDIGSNRYLMLYSMTKANSAISFIGQDKEGRLIINLYYVQEKKVKGSYAVYQANMKQMIFKKLNTNNSTVKQFNK